jgi:tetratricopeptide (TPR) repeat protein
MAEKQQPQMFSALGTNWGLNSGPFTDITGTLAPPSSGAPVTDPYRNAAIKMEGYADQFNKRGVDDASRLTSNLLNNAGMGLGSSPMRTSMNSLNKDRQREYFDTMSKISDQAFNEQMQTRGMDLKDRQFEFQKRQQTFDEMFRLKQMSEDQYKHAVATNFQALGVKMDQAKFKLAMENAKNGNKKEALKIMLEALKIDSDTAYKASHLRTHHEEFESMKSLQQQAMNDENKAKGMMAHSMAAINIAQSLGGIMNTINSIKGLFGGGNSGGNNNNG